MFKRKAVLVVCLPLVALGWCLFAAGGVPADNSKTVLIKARRMYTVTHGVIENGEVLVANGKIADVGTNLSVPSDARVLTAKSVIPGLIDLHSHMCMANQDIYEKNYVPSIAAAVRIYDSFDFDCADIADAAAGGVTMVVVRPGSSHPINGTGMAVKLKARSRRDMLVKQIADIKLAHDEFRGTDPSTGKLAVGEDEDTYYPERFLEKTRQQFHDAQEYQKQWEQYEQEKKAGRDATPPARDLNKEILVKALKREIPVHIHCWSNPPALYSNCIELADEFHLKLVLAHSPVPLSMIDKFKNRPDINFNVGPSIFWSDAILEMIKQGSAPHSFGFENTPAIMANAGYTVSLQTDAEEGFVQARLLEAISFAVRYGMRQEDALKAVTLNGAKGVGLDDRMGSIDKGKDADLVLLDGDPFEFTSAVTEVLIDGSVEYERDARHRSSPELPAAETKHSAEFGNAIENANRYAIRGATFLTMAGAPISNGTLIVNSGKIEKVGASVSVPKDVPVLDAHGYYVMPGLINGRSQAGLDKEIFSCESKPEYMNPQRDLSQEFDPSSRYFSHALDFGVTSLMTSPGDFEMLGGQSIVLKTAGSSREDKLLKPRAMMIFNLASARKSDGYPTSRMGVVAVLRQTLIRATEYRAQRRGNANSTGVSDPVLEALQPVLAGSMPVLVHAACSPDIRAAINLVDEFQLRVIIAEGIDAYRFAPELKKRNITLILSGPPSYRVPGSCSYNPEGLRILTQAGVPFAFKADENPKHAAISYNGDPLEIAALAYREGVPEDIVLKAVTSTAAKILGVSDRIGSLEPGKDADILILGGHPLRTLSVPELVIVNGKPVHHWVDRTK